MAYHLVTKAGDCCILLFPVSFFSCAHPMIYCYSCVVAELDFVFANTFCALF